MKAKILHTECIKLDPYQTPYYDIEFTHNNETKVLHIGCTAWDNKKDDVEKYIKKHWEEFNNA